MNAIESLKLLGMLLGFAFTIISFFIGGAIAWTKITAKTDSLASTDEKQWAKIDALEKWTVARDKSISDMRLELEKEIGLVRENANTSKSKLDVILNSIDELKDKLGSLEERLFQRKKA